VAFWNPYARLDKLPVAVVNLDRPVRADGATVHVGNDLVGDLRKSKSFDWRVVSATQARTGLKNGSYSMAMTIPADFSSRLTSAGVRRRRGHTPGARKRGPQPARHADRQPGVLQLRDSLSQVTTQGYLSHLFVGLASVQQGMTRAERAPARCRSLCVAPRPALEPHRRHRRGRPGLAPPLRRPGQPDQRRPHSRWRRRHTGRRRRPARDRTQQRHGRRPHRDRGSHRLASGAGTLAGGLAGLASGATQLHSAAATLAGGAAQVHSGLTTAAGQTATAAATSGQLAAERPRFQQALAAYIAAHPDAADLSALQTAAAGAGQVAGGLSQLHGGLAAATPQLEQLEAGAPSSTAAAHDLPGRSSPTARP